MLAQNVILEEIAVRLTDEKEDSLLSVRDFPPNPVGRLIFSQSDKDSVPQERLIGPTEIGDLGDELESHPMHLGQGQRAAEPTPPRRG